MVFNATFNNISFISWREGMYNNNNNKKNNNKHCEYSIRILKFYLKNDCRFLNM